MATIDTDAPESNAILSATNLFQRQLQVPEVNPFDTINDESIPEVNPFDTINPDYVSEEEAARDPSKTASVEVQDVEDDFGRTFKKGVRSGVLGIKKDINNFNALVSSIKGDEAGFFDSLDKAGVAEAQAGLNAKGTTSFGEFVEKPKTFEGFAKQVTQVTGQVIPYAIGSIAGGIYGAIGGSLAKIGLNLAGRKYLKKKIKDITEKKLLKKELSVDEQALLDAGYGAFRTVGKGTSLGAKAGAFGFNYPLLAGSSFQEFEEGGQELNATRAWQALGIAIPQAAAEVTGEAFILKTLGKLALKDATKNGASLGMKRLASDISKTALKTGVSETAVELTQEGISVAQRFSIDDTYTLEQAQLRLGEAAFGGFFGGGAIGGAGAAPASVFSQARQMLSNKSEASADADESRVTFGASDENLQSPTAEPASDIDAQIAFTIDPNSQKNVTFIPEGSAKAYRNADGTTLSAAQLDEAKNDTSGPIAVEGGFLGHAAGRGFIFSPDKAAITNLQDAGATSSAAFDEALASDFDYTDVKPESPDGLVTIKNANGNVIFEQAVDSENDPEGAQRAFEEAETVASTVPDSSGTVGNIKPEIIAVDEALKRRKDGIDSTRQAKVDDETTVDPQEDDGIVRNMEFTDDQLAQLRDRGISEEVVAELAGLEIAPEEEATSNSTTFRTQEELTEFLDTKTSSTDLNETMRDLVDVNGQTVTFTPRLSDPKKDKEFNEAVILFNNKVKSYINAATESGVARRQVNPTQPQLNPTTFERVEIELISRDRVIGNEQGYSFTDYTDSDSKRNSDFDEKFDSTVALIEDEQTRNNVIENKKYISDSVLNTIRKELQAFPSVGIDLNFVETNSGSKLIILREQDAFIDVEVTNSAATQVSIDETFNSKPETVAKINKESPFELVQLDKNGNEVKRQPISIVAITELGKLINIRTEQQFIGDDKQGKGQYTKNNFYAGITALITHKSTKKSKYKGSTYSLNYTRDDNSTLIETKSGKPNNLYSLFKNDTTRIFPNTANEFTLDNLIAVQDVNVRSSEDLAVDFDPTDIEEKEGAEDAFNKVDTNVEEQIFLGSRGKIVRTKRSAKVQADIRLAASSVLSGFVKKLTNIYKMQKPPTLLTLADVKSLLEQSRTGGPNFWARTKLFNPPNNTTVQDYSAADVVKYLSQIVESMEKGNVRGSVIKHRNLATPIIILRDGSSLNTSIRDFSKLDPKQQATILNDVSVALHEYGHLVFDQQFKDLQLDKNKNIKDRLWKAFTSTRDSLQLQGQEVKQYQQEDQKKAFEEWYADQVSAYVNKLVLAKESKKASDIKNAKPKNIIDTYFKKLAQVFLTIYEAYLSGVNTGFRRFASNTTFSEYFDGVLKANSKAQDVDRVVSQEPSATENFVVDNYISDIKLRVPPSAVKKLTAAVRKVLSAGDGAYLQKFLKIAAPVTTFYRNLGPYGEKLANFWNKKSQTEGPEGYNDVRVTKRNEFLNALEDIVGLPVNRWGELEQLFELVEDDTKATDTLPPKARKIREFLSKTIYDDYVINPKTGEPFIQSMEYEIDPVTGAPVIDPATGKKIEVGKKSMGKLKDYYPRLLNVAEVSRDPSFFIDLLYEELLIARKNGNIESVLGIDMQNATDEDLQKRAYEVVSKIANKAVEHGSALELGNDGISEVAMDTISQRTLSWITTSKIRAYERRRNISGNILLPAHYAILPYISQVVKKVEFERRGGIEYLNSLVEKIIKERHPQDAVKRAKLKKELEDSFDGQLGRTGTDIKEGYKTFNSIATVWTVFTTLSMATLSSFTDLGAIATRSKEFGNVRDLIRDLKSNMSMEEFKQLSRDLGVTSSDAVASAYLTPGDLDWQQEWASSSLDWFFKATLLTQYTNFTRELAVGMGKRFIINSAVRDTKRNTRYLAELGLTPAEVKQWQADGENFNSEVGRKVGSAIRQFADESIIRPNPGERPSWANSPYLQIVFSLKSYFYSYGTTVLGGMGREFKNRYREDGHINGGAALLLLGAGTMLPLAMIGVESREWIKYLGQTALPGVDAGREVFRSDFMSWPEYISDILNRAGIYGPWTIAESMWSGINHGDNPFVSQIPIVDMADSVLFEDNLARAFPFINNFGVKF